MRATSKRRKNALTATSAWRPPACGLFTACRSHNEPRSSGRHLALGVQPGAQIADDANAPLATRTGHTASGPGVLADNGA